MTSVDKIFTIVPIGEAYKVDERSLTGAINEEFVFQAPSLYDGVVGKMVKETFSSVSTRDIETISRELLAYEQVLEKAVLYNCREIVVRPYHLIGDKDTLYNSTSHVHNVLHLLDGGDIRLDRKTIAVLKSTIGSFFYPNIRSIWERFDGIYALCCEKYQERIPHLKEELKRVDLLDRVEIKIDLKNPFIDYLAKNIRYGMAGRSHWFRCGYSHYKVILEALYAGKQHILMMEDDIAFLKDKNLLARFVNSLPANYDFAMFDKSWRIDQSSSFDKAQFEWHGFIKFHSSGCYAMSRKGMEKYVRLYEDSLAKGTVMNNDQYFDRKYLGDELVLYAAYPNVAMQNRFNSLSNLDIYYRLHVEHGAKLDNYNLIEVPQVKADQSDKQMGKTNGYTLGGSSPRQGVVLRHKLTGINVVQHSAWKW